MSCIARKPTYALVLRNIGVACLFLSWVAQYWLTARQMDRRMKLEYDLSYISNEVSVATPWNIFFNTERSKSNPNPEVIWNASVNYMHSVIGILEIAEAYYPANIAETELTSNKATNVLAEIRKFKGTQEIDKVASLTLLVMAAFPQISEKSKSFIANEYETLRRAESTYSNIFVALYIVGSLMLAMGFVLSTVKPGFLQQPGLIAHPEVSSKS